MYIHTHIYIYVYVYVYVDEDPVDALRSQGQLDHSLRRARHPKARYPYNKDFKKHISISILKGYPYLIGLLYKGVYMGYPYPNFCLCAFFGAPYKGRHAQKSGGAFRI